MPVRGRESGLTSTTIRTGTAEYPARVAVSVEARTTALPTLGWLTGYRDLLRTLVRRELDRQRVLPRRRAPAGRPLPSVVLPDARPLQPRRAAGGCAAPVADSSAALREPGDAVRRRAAGHDPPGDGARRVAPRLHVHRRSSSGAA